jgi:hypothetical protein
MRCRKLREAHLHRQIDSRRPQTAPWTQQQALQPFQPYCHLKSEKNVTSNFNMAQALLQFKYQICYHCLHNQYQLQDPLWCYPSSHFLKALS